MSDGAATPPPAPPVTTPGRPPAYVTTSWDDGGHDDVRLVEVLQRHGVRGTLYWTLADPEHPLLGQAATAELLDAGIEIGSHTVSHIDVTRTPPARLAQELADSKAALEDHTGAPVRSFCYPFGHFDTASREAVVRAGYTLGRTTQAFRTDTSFDPFLMPVTFQVLPHGRSIHVRHTLKERNVSGLRSWFTRFHAGADLVDLATAGIDHIRRHGGVLHLWGHSWEVDHNGLWDELDRILEVVGGHDDVAYVNNIDVVLDRAASSALADPPVA